ncbi:MAG: hypothetical protein N2037_13570, partial [Acidimicrobiales bacterium]|nr:hypothetical protein [Acidimicrobiales bacterium]
MTRWVRFPLSVFVAVWFALVLVTWFSAAHLERHPDYPQPPGQFAGSAVLEGWKRWDGNWYEIIATEGYWLTPGQQSPVAFFPVYPLAMRALGAVLGDVNFAGIVITVVSGAIAAVLFWRWAADHSSSSAANASLVTFLLYPYAWYLFGATYADALFLAAVLGSFLLLENGHPVLAGVVGAVATATRPTGIAVAVGLTVLMLERHGILRAAPARDTERRPVRVTDAAVLLSVVGLAAWMTYLWLAFGSPTAFAQVQEAPGWDQGSGPRTWFKITYLQHIHHLPEYLNDAFFSGPSASDPKPWTNAVYTLGTVSYTHL